MKNVSDERVWTLREFQTVEAATQNALDANAIGLSHARPNSGISGALLSENEAKPVVICCSGGGCYSLVRIAINFAVVNW